MKPSRTMLLAATLAVLGLTGAVCDKNGAGPEHAKVQAAPDASTPPAAAPAAAPAPSGRSAVAEQLLAAVPEPARRELQTVFSDEFCYCGCPHTLGQCLQTHPECQHAPRMAVLAASEAAAGVPATEIIVLLGRYYQSFLTRQQFTPDPRMCMGPQNAKVTLLEFSDFECPYCAAARPMLESFVKGRPQVRLCYAPFPLQAHPNAMPAAQAAMFARDQGKFWPMHDALFEHQAELSREKILELGEKVGLPKAQLAEVLNSGRYVDELQALKEQGKRAGVDHTPMVYVNGRPLLLGLSEEALEHTVRDELEWMANGGWAKD